MPLCITPQMSTSQARYWLPSVPMDGVIWIVAAPSVMRRPVEALAPQGQAMRGEAGGRRTHVDHILVMLGGRCGDSGGLPDNTCRGGGRRQGEKHADPPEIGDAFG